MELKNSNKSKVGNITTFGIYILLNNQLVKEEIKIEMGKYVKINEDENTVYQNLWDAIKVMLRGNFQL